MTINRNNAMATRTILRVPPEPQGTYKPRHLAQQRACPSARRCRTETFCGDTYSDGICYTAEDPQQADGIAAAPRTENVCRAASLAAIPAGESPASIGVQSML